MCRSNIKDDYFEYNELFKNFESKKIESVINSLRQPFADIAKNLDITTNTQWIVRTYLASKMILASSVMLTSAEYAESKNLRIVNPYLMYYPLLSSLQSEASNLTMPIVLSAIRTTTIQLKCVSPLVWIPIPKRMMTFSSIAIRWKI